MPYRNGTGNQTTTGNGTMNTDGTHSYAEIYAKDFEPYCHFRIALNSSGEPARSIASARRSVIVTNVERLTGYRTRITLETGRTMTMADGRWVLTEAFITN